MTHDWLLRRAQLTPAKVALIDTLQQGRLITYREWNHRANQTANYLRTQLGLRAGERVAVLAMNCVAYLEIWFACNKLGAVLQTLNWRLTPAELIELIRDGAPRVLLYGPEFQEQANWIGRHPSGAHLPQLALSAFEAGVADSSPEPPPAVELQWDSPWVICYTGGTTGTPKGAVLTYRSITANSVNTVMSWGLSSEDVTILNAPLFHTGGLNVFTAPLVHIGGTSIICRSFDTDQVFDLLCDGGVTVYFGVPTTFIALQQHPRWATADFSRLKLLISGGAPCPLPVFEKFWARGVDFKTGYGLTEAGPNTFWLPPEDVRRKPGAVGFPLFHVEVKLVDEHGAVCAPEVVGQLLIRGPHVFGGYWNRPDETARTLVNGWLQTGDLARCDAEGYYTIVGRSKDLIISGGENIYPAEVENVLAAHPAVAEVALIGVPDEKWGEVGRAIVVAHGGQTATTEELLASCQDRLARYKIPQSVVWVDALPKTGAGKVDKNRLQQLYGSSGQGV